MIIAYVITDRQDLALLQDEVKEKGVIYAIICLIQHSMYYIKTYYT